MTLQEIKKEFFAFRNGIVADTLRKGGMPYKVIFGLNVPQLSALGRRVLEENGAEEGDALARELWSDKDSREARLLACWLFDPTKFDIEASLRLCAEVQTREEAEIMSFRLLKRLDHAQLLAALLSPSAVPLERYTAEVLRRHLEG